MTDVSITEPIVFEPLFMERIWGGRRLQSLFGKPLPLDVRIGESWEIVDRPEAQSVVTTGPLRGRTLHDLWRNHRSEIFGEMPDSDRFPLMIKILDATEKLSLQVHPPADIAAELGGEPKSEFWYIVDALPSAELYVGLNSHSSRAMVENALQSGDVEEHVHRIAVHPGDAIFLPSGRLHAIGAGNVLVEIQQNSDTTYRVFDWNRLDAEGRARDLHIEESLRSIDFDDYEAELISPAGESLVRHSLFEVEKWNLSAERVVSPLGKLAIIGCLSGQIDCAGTTLRPGEFLLVPSSLKNRTLRALEAKSSLLRVTIPA